MASEYIRDQKDALGEEALKHAAEFKNPMRVDPRYSWLHTVVALRKEDFHTAYTFINEAIIADPNYASYYTLKGDILAYLIDEARDQNQSAIAFDYMKLFFDTYEKALDLYRKCNDTFEQMKCLERLAYAYTIELSPNYALAKKYAEEAISLGSKDDRVKEVLQLAQSQQEQFRPYQDDNNPVSSSQGGCYIATSVYGSYDCPEVWTLRRYRDYVLSKTAQGRLFIRLYYYISPKLVLRFGKSDWFKILWKRNLDKMVMKLKAKGFSSDPYYD